MNSDPIGDIVSGDFRLPDNGERISCPVRSLIIEPSLDGGEGSFLERLGLSSSPTIVCDPKTQDVLANRVASGISGAKLVVIEAPKADEVTLDDLNDRTRHADTLIAVGAGTLNDLTKYVSHRRKRPYAVFATAPSMNGYVTATASISRNGEKLSLPATPPLGAFFDLTILANAPGRLIRAGVGDSLCRSTAEIDWLLSHYLIGTDFLETAYAIQRKDEAALLAGIDRLKTGDISAITALTRLLVLGGLGMLIAGNSQPGSQSEHLISHYIDQMHQPHPGSLHGEQVGLATRTMTALQHRILCNDEPPVLAEAMFDPDSMLERPGVQRAFAVTATRKKALIGDRLETLNRRLAEHWPTLRKAYGDRALPPHKLQAAFDSIDMARGPQDLGIAPPLYREAVLHANMLRDRFTVLDVASSAGILHSFVVEQLAGNPA